MRINNHTDKFEGGDILELLSNHYAGEENLEDFNANELTVGRIRTIYAQVKYGSKSPREIAEYYDLPEGLIRDIGRRRTFREITKDMDNI